MCFIATSSEALAMPVPRAGEPVDDLAPHRDHEQRYLRSDGGPLPTELNLLTLNCWGLLHVSTLRRARLAAIGRSIAALDPTPHIVCLQECWVQSDYRAVRDAVRELLPHAKFYNSGAFGGGLALFSRWPIEESSMIPYQLNGRPTAFWRGDWYVGKGVACATIRYGPAADDVLEVFNTHTHAPYESGPQDSYLCHRTAQAWEMSKILRNACARGRLVLAFGDFNMLPQSLEHRIITSRASVQDVWRVLHPHSSLGPADHPDERARGVLVPTAEFNIRENGSTSDGLYNTWRWTKNRQNKLRPGKPCPVNPEAPDVHGKRLDYIFCSKGRTAHTDQSWTVKSARVALTERHPDLHVSLSDHFAVYATLTHQQSLRNAERRALELEKDEMNHVDAAADQDKALALSDYDEILAMTRKYTAREHSQQRLRAYRFYAAVIVWVGCLVAVWFSPRNFVAFLLMLLASLILAAGVIEGLLALLFFSWEIGKLAEFAWEIENARKLAAVALEKRSSTGI